MFVDDFVQGNLPARCAVTGVPTNHYLTVKTSTASNWALLLVFLGPPGWLALLVVGFLGGTVEGVLPIDPEVQERRRRFALLGLAGGVCAVAASFVAIQTSFPVSVVASLVAFTGVALAARGLYVASRLPAIRLDGSRRWITIRGAHADFAEAVDRLRTDGLLRSGV